MTGGLPPAGGARVLVRDADQDDWPAIHPLFAAVMAEGRTYVYPDGLTSEQARALWLLPPPARTVVAMDGDALLGTATYGPNRPGHGSHVATASFLVDPAARGRGVGRALGEHVLARAAREGYRAVQFNAVVETNEPAVRLWRSLGFSIVGTVPEAFRHPEHGLVGLHVMHRALDPDPVAPGAPA